MGNQRHDKSNIAIVTPAVAREGITKQAANQITALQSKGIIVFLVVLSDFNQKVLIEMGVQLPQENILLLKQPVSYLSQKALLYSITTIFPIIRFFKRNNVGIVIAHAPYAHFVMRLAKMLSSFFSLRLKLYQYYHGLQYAEYPINTIRRRVINKINIMLAKCYDNGHISVSNAAKDDVEKNFIKHDNHVVIYNSLPVNKGFGQQDNFEWEGVQNVLTYHKGKFIMLLPGRIDHNKGQLFFISVLKKFIAQNSIASGGIMLLLVGDGPQKKDVEEFIMENKLSSLVKLLGSLSNRVVQRMMKETDLVVVPSMFEGLPFTVLEAFSAGCMVLASDAGGLKEVIKNGETGFLFKAGNAEDCLARLNYIYSNRSRKLISQEKIEEDLQERFSIESYRRELLKMLKSI
ncbi:glycosyltransferase family 4 protein [Pontibacter harenae]|uniref:glycosyltransferase family 4 protein n=1 Tax=Pontibacter harenae TaxID=2894083 RepID=UPI001E5F3A37|nr:glycosyltransferase family 4 protein [Pontibacter harenae]MCC9168862.1 glycosyltransferase family 4 protein [Pontibacter harenae]